MAISLQNTNEFPLFLQRFRGAPPHVRAPMEKPEMEMKWDMEMGMSLKMKTGMGIKQK